MTKLLAQVRAPHLLFDEAQKDWKIQRVANQWKDQDVELHPI
jgi:hypothetical protein